jgi:hypothetical protein
MAEWKLALALLAERFAICRLSAETAIPAWALSGPLTSITRTPDELSVVCAESSVPAGVVIVSAGWRCLRVTGPLDFALTGVLAALAGPLAEEGISIFALSTYDTDYLLVREQETARAVGALIRAGHTVDGASPIEARGDQAREAEPS